MSALRVKRNLSHAIFAAGILPVDPAAGASTSDIQAANALRQLRDGMAVIPLGQRRAFHLEADGRALRSRLANSVSSYAFRSETAQKHMSPLIHRTRLYPWCCSEVAES